MSNPICTVCGHTKDDHPYRHPFMGIDATVEQEAEFMKVIKPEPLSAQPKLAPTMPAQTEENLYIEARSGNMVIRLASLLMAKGLLTPDEMLYLLTPPQQMPVMQPPTPPRMSQVRTTSSQDSE